MTETALCVWEVEGGVAVDEGGDGFAFEFRAVWFFSFERVCAPLEGEVFLFAIPEL
jgi:hypothetical protein